MFSQWLTDTRVRYVLVSVITGIIDYFIAFVLLRWGASPAVGLACGIVFAGALAYLALEWWVFPRRRGGLSLGRLLGSGAAEAGTYAVRLTAIHVWLRFFPSDGPADHALALAVAYAAGFVFGYLFRRRIVFARGGEP